MVRVVIADDHRIFRESLRCMLDLDPDMEVLDTVGDGQALLATVRRSHPDVVCMDVKMPGIDGIETTRQLHALFPDINVIGLSAFADRYYVLDMLSAGARGYVTKSEAPAELQNAIHSVAEGQFYFCPEVATDLRRRPHSATPAQALRFLPGSQEVKDLLAEIHRASEDVTTPTPSPDEFLRLWQVVEESSMPSFVIDQEHRVAYWNKACAALTGIPASAMVGTCNPWQAFYAEVRPVLADLILVGADDAEMARYYEGRCRRSVLIDGAYEGEDFFPQLGEHGRWLYFTAAPLHDQHQHVIGVVETLQDVSARYLAEAALKESEARYRQLSITDNLTGLFNSRHFYDRLKTEIGRAIRYDHPLSLVMLDVDDFKHFNDTYGHLEGDQVLIKLGEVIRNCPRQGDSGYRLGGEEFAVLMPDTDLESARLAAERLRATFAALTLNPAPGVSVHASISVGVTLYHPCEQYSALLRRADVGCYDAKRQGKNCVVVAQAPPPSGE